MKIRGVFFDLGFTLITIPNFNVKEYLLLLKKGLLDLEQYLIKEGMIKNSHTFFKTTRKIQKKYLRKYFETEKEFSTEFILKEAFSTLKIPHDEELVKKSAEIYHNYELKSWILKKGVIPVMIDLSQKYKLAIISNAIYHDGIMRILENLKLQNYFNVIISSASVGLRKPNKEIFLTALKNLELIPENCIFVGDDLHADVYGAKQLNLKTIKIKRTFYLPALKQVNVIPDHEILEIPEVLDILKKYA